MEQKMEFVNMALNSELSMNELCDRFGISRPTGYKWLKRYREEGLDGLYERSRRPLRSPARTAEPIERLIVELRKDDPAWGARKLHRILERGIESGRYHIDRLPCPSTVHRILKRKGLVEKHKSDRATVHQRFERDMPNELWQMDFKGYFRTLGRPAVRPIDRNGRSQPVQSGAGGMCRSKDRNGVGTFEEFVSKIWDALGDPMRQWRALGQYGHEVEIWGEKLQFHREVVDDPQRKGNPWQALPSANTGKRGKVP